MWLMTKYGFFSIVRARDMKTNGPHGDLYMVRARKHAHLRSLCDNFFVQQPEIKKSINTDYPYRIFVTTAQMLDVVDCLAGDIDYCNFKEAAKDTVPQDTAYINFLHRVWSAGLSITPQRVRKACHMLFDAYV